MNPLNAYDLILKEEYYLELPRYRNGKWYESVCKIKAMLDASAYVYDYAGALITMTLTFSNITNILPGQAQYTDKYYHIDSYMKFDPCKFYGLGIYSSIKGPTKKNNPLSDQNTHIYKPMKEILTKQRNDRILERLLQHIVRDDYFTWA